MKENYSEKDIHAIGSGIKGEGSNWLPPEEVRKIIDSVLSTHPNAEIEYSGEFILVKKKNGNTEFIPRWKRIPRTKDKGKTISNI